VLLDAVRPLQAARHDRDDERLAVARTVGPGRRAPVYAYYQDNTQPDALPGRSHGAPARVLDCKRTSTAGDELSTSSGQPAVLPEAGASQARRHRRRGEPDTTANILSSAGWHRDGIVIDPRGRRQRARGWLSSPGADGRHAHRRRRTQHVVVAFQSGAVSRGVTVRAGDTAGATIVPEASIDRPPAGCSMFWEAGSAIIVGRPDR
jgi:hypothetical protein